MPHLMSTICCSGEEGTIEGSGLEAEPEIEATAVSMPAEPTGMTAYDSMYDEESTLSAGKSCPALRTAVVVLSLSHKLCFVYTMQSLHDSSRSV